MHHHVDAERDGVLIDGGRESIVDDANSAVLARHSGDRRQVNAPQQGIGRGFDENQARGRPDRRRELIRRCSEGNLDSKSREFAADKVVSAPVQIRLKNRVITRFKMSKKHGGDRGHSRTEHQALLGLFQCRHLLRHRFLVRHVEVSWVNVFVGCVRILIGGGRKNRSPDPAGALVDVCACVDAKGRRSKRRSFIESPNIGRGLAPANAVLLASERVPRYW